MLIFVVFLVRCCRFFFMFQTPVSFRLTDSEFQELVSVSQLSVSDDESDVEDLVTVSEVSVC